MSPKLIKPNQKKRPLFRLATGAKYRKTDGTSAPAILPRVGPFASLAATPISGLPDFTLGSPANLAESLYNSPFKYKNYTLNSGGTVPPDETYAFFLWCDHFILGNGGQILALGETPPDAGGCQAGGKGGDGGSGGGGGAGFYQPCCGCGMAAGGAGGPLNPGCFLYDGGNGDSVGTSGGFGGSGWAQNWSTHYAWPNGSAGDGSGCQSGGSGGPGYGGGGAGGPAFHGCCACAASGGGGGGGGGKLIVSVSNYTSFNQTSSVLSTAGGLGGAPSNGGQFGGDGGAGSILIMTKQWSAPPVAMVGSIEVWEINHAGTGITRRLDYASASWNNN